MNNNSKVIIDSREGKVIDSFTPCKVTLLGEYSYEKNKLIEKIQLGIESYKDGIQRTIDLPYKGYEFKLFLGDFNKDGKEEILLRGTLGDSNSGIIAAVYGYNHNKIEEIFNQDMFSEQYKFQGKFLEGYKAEVISLTSKEKFIIDLSSRSKSYLNFVFQGSGKVKENNYVKVSKINTAYPISSLMGDDYGLFVQQRIIGIASEDTLGILESFIYLNDNKININRTGILTLGKKYEEKESPKEDGIVEIPEGAVPVSLNRFGGKDGVIKIDLDGDRKEEVLAIYTLDSVNYVAVFKKQKEGMVLSDVFKSGKDRLENLTITKLKRNNSIIIEWRVGSKSNKVDILIFKEGRLKREFEKQLPLCGRIDIEDMSKNGKKELALWRHSVADAYEISIYEIYNDNLELTNKFDKIYYKKVVEYYKKLIERNVNGSLYLYYLALAYEKLEKYVEAVTAIDNAMDTSSPYPSIRELVKLRVKLVRLVMDNNYK